MADTIYYVCRYTPIELLDGFGLPAVRLDPAPLAFECAESCAHPNLCGYGKAVLEEVLQRNIKRLLLVDCCDVCRRVYDVLEGMGDMEFLFLLSLPHKNGPAERQMLAGELSRLADSLRGLAGVPFDAGRALAAWARGRREAMEQSKDAPYISVTGAHGGARLLEAIREKTALPVRDDTCTGVRLLPAPGEQTGFLPGYAGALIDQARPCMRMQFRKESGDEQAAGVICHTVKFCDYYSFQYINLRDGEKKPLLKIETDCTAQSSGQMDTRLEAFCEAIGVKSMPLLRSETKKQYVAGIDSGSASTDAVILNMDGEIVGSAILPTGTGAASGAEKALETALRSAGLRRAQLDAVVTTGYGRDSIGQGDASVTEITCHARGAHRLYPGARTVIDIGGQDSKVIRLDEKGQVINFVMNDKCAAGTGRFLDMIAHTMGLSLEEMSALGLKWKRDVSISSMCTVFAESEVVSLIARNTDMADIIHGLNKAVAVKTAALVRRADGQPAYMMTGGVAQNRGVVQALEEKLGAPVHVSGEAQLCGALGAALIALDAFRQPAGK